MRRVPGCIAINEIKGMVPSRKSFGKVYGFQLNSHLPMHLSPASPSPPKKRTSQHCLIQCQAKRDESLYFWWGLGRARVGTSKRFQADVYKQKVTDKNPNTMPHCLPCFTDEPIGTPAKSRPGKHPRIKRCKQAA